MSTRIKGKRLGLTLGTPSTQVWQDIRGLTLQSDEPDDPTFGDIAAGLAKWLLSGNAIQSTDPTSFWSYVWENSGQRVAYTYAVHGNATPSPAQPHFTGYVYIGRKPSLGGEANSAGYEFEFEWEVDGEPERDTGVYANWSATTAYPLNRRVKVGAATLEAAVAGTSGAAAPTAPATVGGTVVDGSVTWKKIA